jgi:hypothetical protein
MTRAEAKYKLTAVDGTQAAINSASNGFKRLDKLSGKLKGGLGALGAGLTAGAFIAFIKNANDAADRLNDLHSITGLSIGTLSKLKYAAEQSGTDLDGAAAAVGKMNKALAEAADKGGPAGDMLGKLHLDAKKLVASGPEQAFLSIVSAMEKIQAPAERTRVAMAFFGKAGQDLIPMLAGGAAGIKEMFDQAVKLGLVLDEAGVKKMAATDDAMQRLKGGMLALGQSIAVSLGPVLADFANWLAVKIPEAIDFFDRAALKWTKAQIAAHSVLAKLPGGIGKRYAESVAYLTEKVANWGKVTEEQASPAANRYAYDLALVNDATEKQAELMKEGAKLTESLRTPYEKYADELERIGKLLEKGAIQLPAYYRAQAEADANYLDAIANKVGKTLDGIAMGQTNIAETAESLFEATRTPLEKYNDALAMSKGLYDANKIGAETYWRAIKLFEKEYRDATDQAEDGGRRMGAVLATLSDIAERSAADLSNAFLDAFTATENRLESLRAFAENILMDIAGALLTQYITGPIVNAFKPKAATGGGSTVGPRADVYVPVTPAPMPRAYGGPVVPGVRYLTGERGPEIVEFPAAGRVSAAGAGGGGIGAVHIHISALDTRTGLEMVNRMARPIAAKIESEYSRRGRRGPLRGGGRA